MAETIAYYYHEEREIEEIVALSDRLGQNEVECIFLLVSELKPILKKLIKYLV